MYTAQILDQTFSLDPKQSTLNGAPQTMSITPLPDGGIVVQLNKQQLVADVVSIDKQQKTVTLRIKSQKVTVQIKEPVDLLLEQLGMQQSRVRKVNQLKAPMPGLVLRILVQEGQSVKAGDPLMVLEAMKMENVFKAPADVTVKQIKVSEKQAVEKNTELMTFA
ncbi:MAG: biotin/lipoyl-containing protein [Chitinophagaceae bacterium]